MVCGGGRASTKSSQVSATCPRQHGESSSVLTTGHSRGNMRWSYQHQCACVCVTARPPVIAPPHHVRRGMEERCMVQQGVLREGGACFQGDWYASVIIGRKVPHILIPSRSHRQKLPSPPCGMLLCPFSPMRQPPTRSQMHPMLCPQPPCRAAPSPAAKFPLWAVPGSAAHLQTPE